MNNMNVKNVVLKFTIVLFSLFLFGCNSNKSDKLKIGLVVDLSGYTAAFGQGSANAVELLKEKYPDVEFYIEDSKGEPKTGISQANKLLNVYDVDLIYCDLSTVSNAINPILQEKGKVLMATVYLDNLLKINEYAIRNLPSAQSDCELLINFLNVNNLPSNKVAILISNDEFGNSAAKIFKGLLNKEGKIVFEDVIPENNLIKSTVVKLLQTEPNVIFIGSLLPSVGNVIKELKVNGYNGEILTNNSFSYPYISDIAGEYGNGVIYQEFPETQQYLEFKDLYYSKFNIEPIPLSVQCYDGLSFFIENWTGNPEETIAKMNDTTFLGIYGTISMRNREIIYPTYAKRWRK